jgi:hypothetical protein
VIPDAALEANRRAAWARFYAARAELAEVRLRCAELAEWAAANRAVLPAPLAAIVADARSAVTPADRAMLRRFVAYHEAAA